MLWREIRLSLERLVWNQLKSRNLPNGLLKARVRCIRIIYNGSKTEECAARRLIFTIVGTNLAKIWYLLVINKTHLSEFSYLESLYELVESRLFNFFDTSVAPVYFFLYCLVLWSLDVWIKISYQSFVTLIVTSVIAVSILQFWLYLNAISVIS